MHVLVVVVLETVVNVFECVCLEVDHLPDLLDEPCHVRQDERHPDHDEYVRLLGLVERDQGLDRLPVREDRLATPLSLRDLVEQSHRIQSQFVVIREVFQVASQLANGLGASEHLNAGLVGRQVAQTVRDLQIDLQQVLLRVRDLLVQVVCRHREEVQEVRDHLHVVGRQLHPSHLFHRGEVLQHPDRQVDQLDQVVVLQVLLWQTLLPHPQNLHQHVVNVLLVTTHVGRLLRYFQHFLQGEVQSV